MHKSKNVAQHLNFLRYMVNEVNENGSEKCTIFG